ncbi:MAG TPA: DNA ligase D [Casimicrobiaceae bacterium]|nr:DNA ligase D [Casimicrobiaceae bacterium]
MGLERYRQKRNFGVTPEPEGEVGAKTGAALRFVIQKHAARRLHYDFRLELDGVMLSWAVPKGPSLDPNDKRLAMHVEDHPLEYGDFEGVIPAKQYGAGTVMLWDRGTWIPKSDPREGVAKGRLKFDLSGEKLHGGWNLVRSRSGKYGGESWLLIKEADAYARLGAAAAIVDDMPDSVATGRSIEEIAASADRVWHSNKSAAANVEAGAIARAKPLPGIGKVPGARKAAMPSFIEPELATLMKAPPDGAKWIHEIKYDGYRMLCRIADGSARMISRNRKDWTGNFEAVAEAAARLPVKTAWLDGEVVAFDAEGRSSFQALQNALTASPAADLGYLVFDLLYLDGFDLTRVTLAERKRLLQSLLADASGGIRYSDHFSVPGRAFLENVRKLGLEGMVSKRADLPHHDGRGTAWIKVKCQRRQEMVVGGYTEPGGSRHGFGALLLGVYEGAKLRYSGRVGTGFDDAALASIKQKLDKLEQPKSPFENPPTGADARGVHWLRPTLVAEVEFTEWTADGTLRHPSFVGLRADKRATDVVREIERAANEQPPGDAAAQAASAVADPIPLEGPKARAAARSYVAKKGRSAAKEAVAAKTPRSCSTAKSVPANPPKERFAAPSVRASARGSIAGIALTNPDKVLYPEAGVTKRDLARFYERIADWILPHFEQRPLTLLRCPNGWDKPCFYQKNADASVIDAIDRVKVPASNGKTSLYMMANSLTAIVGLVQMGTLELHPWGSTAGRLGYPDRLTFDLDPDDQVTWDDLKQAALLVKTLLENVGLQPFVKTTGGKGLHVVVAIEPTTEWEDAKNFTKAAAELLERTFPDRFTSKLLKVSRGGKVFIDYLRNAEGATAVGAYSLRARANAPVSTPIEWKELERDVRFHHFDVGRVLERYAKLKRDPWAGIAKSARPLDKARMAKVGYVKK